MGEHVMKLSCSPLHWEILLDFHCGSTLSHARNPEFRSNAAPSPALPELFVLGRAASWLVACRRCTTVPVLPQSIPHPEVSSEASKPREAPEPSVTHPLFGPDANSLRHRLSSRTK